MTVLFRVTMMFVGYIWACITASLVLALGTLTPQWNGFFASFGLESPQAQSHMARDVISAGLVSRDYQLSTMTSSPSSFTT